MDDIVDLDAPLANGQDRSLEAHADGTQTLRLRHPVSVRLRQGGAERVEETVQLTFRRCNGSDLRAMGAARNDIERSAILFTRMAGISMALYDRLDSEDIEAGMAVISGFLPKPPETGQTSSA